jgi:hypothetical protein
MHAALGKSLEETWVRTTPEEMVAQWRLTAVERFQMTLDNLRAIPPVPPIVAEGYGFLPELVVPLLGSPRQAVWLVPTAAFKRATYAHRVERGEKGTRWPQLSDPARARSNHIGRDLLIGELVQEQARRLGMRGNLLEVDGSRSLDEMIAAVEAHFAPLLPGSSRPP